MKNLWKGVTALALFGAIVATSAAGCVEAEAPFFIIGAKALSCDTVGTDSAELFRGVMDVRYSCGYTAVLRLGNQLVRRGDEAKLQIETSRISVTSFDVEILNPDESPVTRSDTSNAAFSYPTTGFVDASRSGTPGEGLAATQLIDGLTAQTLGERFFDSTVGNEVTTVMARVVAYGRTLGGDDIKTRPWDFPIDICYGCLCDCSFIDDQGPECPIFQDSTFSCVFTDGTCEVDSACLSND